MARRVDIADHREAFAQVKAVRAELLDHARVVRELAAKRRDLIQSLVDIGFSQSEIARELGVTRQAVQKMLAC